MMFEQLSLPFFPKIPFTGEISGLDGLCKGCLISVKCAPLDKGLRGQNVFNKQMTGNFNASY
ncbi:MAG: hypothetical protein CSA53_01325 [Gammaproteobacteria bacterium]|nr:MAG: hypothetical protein CSA53_01325 [Gammaproteobacteria bacterium]